MEQRRHVCRRWYSLQLRPEDRYQRATGIQPCPITSSHATCYATRLRWGVQHFNPVMFSVGKYMVTISTSLFDSSRCLKCGCTRYLYTVRVLPAVDGGRSAHLPFSEAERERRETNITLNVRYIMNISVITAVSFGATFSKPVNFRNLAVQLITPPEISSLGQKGPLQHQTEIKLHFSIDLKDGASVPARISFSKL